jgi:hypothetical protein
MADNSSTQQLFDLWKKQIDEGTQAWLKMAGQGQAPDPQAFWRPFMDQGMQAWSKVMTQGTVSPDLLTQWKQFLDQWIEAWSKVLGQAMGTEQFAKMMGQSLDQMLVTAAPAKKVVDQQIEQALQALNLPSRSQLTGIAKQLVELEDRIDRLEDSINAKLRRLAEREPK